MNQTPPNVLVFAYFIAALCLLFTAAGGLFLVAILTGVTP